MLAEAQPQQDISDNFRTGKAEPFRTSGGEAANNQRISLRQ